MIKITLDISTTASGVVYQNGKNINIHYKLIEVKGYNVMERIRIMAKKIFETIEKVKEFDILIISKASHGNINKYIQLLEGIILGEAIKRNVPFEYYPDSSWYHKMENYEANDERNTKKRKSVERFIKRLGIPKDEIKNYNEKMSGSKLSKITFEYKNKKISDDIADAFNASDLFEKIINKRQKALETSKIRLDIKNLKKEGELALQKAKSLKYQIDNWKAEIKIAETQLKIKKTKTLLNKIDKRNFWIKENEKQVSLIKEKIEKITTKLKEKRKWIK